MNDHFLSRLSTNIYFSNMTWLISERVVRLLVMAFVGVYVARYLGPQRFGLLSFAQSFLAVFVILATLGLDGVVIRELVNCPENQSEILGSAFLLRLFASVLLWLCLGFSFFLFHIPTQESLLVAVLSAGVIFQSFSVIDFYFQSRVESKYVARAQLAQLGISSALKLFLVFTQAELIWFAVVIALDHVFLAFGFYIIYRSKGGDISAWRFQGRVAKRLIINSAPLMIYAFFVMSLMKSDQIMIKVLLNDTEVGWYAAAAMISSLWYFIPVALGSTFNPYIISQVKKQTGTDGIKLIFSVLFSLSVMGALAVFFLAPPIIGLLFGSAYQPAAPVLSILILNSVFVFHVSLRTRVLVAQERHWVSTAIMLGALSLNIIGNLILIPEYGIRGAAWSSVIAWGTSVIVLPLMFSASKKFVMIFLRPRFSGLGELFNAVKS